MVEGWRRRSHSKYDSVSDCIGIKPDVEADVEGPGTGVEGGVGVLGQKKKNQFYSAC